VGEEEAGAEEGVNPVKEVEGEGEGEVEVEAEAAVGAEGGVVLLREEEEEVEVEEEEKVENEDCLKTNEVEGGGLFLKKDVEKNRRERGESGDPNLSTNLNEEER
jgi:hypothetical protein